jgi:hypothetical protein
MSSSAKLALCLLSAAALPSAAFAADTAYTALQAYGKVNGAASLKHVVELRGVGGAPEPEVWKITVEDGSARGGLRETELRHGKVVGERTPTARQTGVAMNFSQLNLDSDGVYTIATQEAQKLSVPADHLDYALRTGTRGGAPVWQVDLFDGRNIRSCTLQIAADSGTVLQRDIYHGAAQGEAVTTQRTDSLEGHHEPTQGGGSDAPGSVAGFLGDVKHHFQKRGRQFKNFFTGRGWTDQ